METELGRLMGSGAGSDVYEYGPDKVCKLYADKYGTSQAEYEYRKTKNVCDNGLPAPKVYEIIERGGRFGLIMERITGRTFNEVFMEFLSESIQKYTPPEEIFYSPVFLGQIKDTAKTLVDLHQKKCKLVETAKSSLRFHCQNNAYLSQDEKKIIAGLIEDLPEGDGVCFGDPNPNNFMYNHGKIMMIDWNDCVNGHPFYDLTEYTLMWEYPNLPTDLPDSFFSFVRYFTEHLTDINTVFLEEYVRLSQIDLAGLEKWRVPVLVSMMGGNNGDDRQKRLLTGIRDGLQKLL